MQERCHLFTSQYFVLWRCVQHSKNETRSSHHMTIRVPTSQSMVTGNNKSPSLQASKARVTSYQTWNYHEPVGHKVNLHHWGETSLARFPGIPPNKALDCKYTPSYKAFINSILCVLIQLTELVVTIQTLFWRYAIRISAGPPFTLIFPRNHKMNARTLELTLKQAASAFLQFRT
jgi:hypothetical protein